MPPSLGSWKPQPGPQEALLACPIQDILFGGSRGGGKRLWVGTPVPVPLSTDPSGYRTMGDLRPGDEVLSPRGEPVRVLAVSPILPAPDTFEVAFSTGEVLLADADHLWHTMTARERRRARCLTDAFRAARRATRPSRAVAASKKPGVSAMLQVANRARAWRYVAPPAGGVRTTAEIAATLKVGPEANHSIACTRPLDLPPADLPIDPYLFGLWLGDGLSGAGKVGMAEEDMLEVAQHLPAHAAEARQPRPGGKPFLVRRWWGLTTTLRALGVLGDKHIPPLYLRASLAQRMALLQGIMDTDGCCAARGQMEIGFSNRRLMDDCHDLLSGLGIKAAITERVACCNGKEIGPTWRIKFTAPFPCFRLPRKAMRQKMAGFRPTTTRRYVVDVRRAEPVLMRCITVDHPDGMFLVGRSMIATHNSSGAILHWLVHAGRYAAGARGLFLRRQFKDLDAIQVQMRRFFRPLNAVWRQRDSTWFFPNGATLKLAHIWDERDADAYQGAEFTWLCVEEAGQYPTPKAIDMLRATLRSTEGVPTFLLLTANPGGAGHQWLRNRYVNPNPRGFSPIVDHETGETRVYIPARLSDNAILQAADPHYARRLRQVGGPTLVRAWLDGDWDIVAGGFFDDLWRPERHVVPRFQVPGAWGFRRAFDWGSAKPAALGVWAVADGVTPPPDWPEFCPPKGSIVLAGECYTVARDASGDAIPNTGLEWTNDRLGQEFARRCAQVTEGRGCAVSVADPSIWARQGGPSIFEQMKAGAMREGDGFAFVRADNSRIAGWQAMRTMMREAASDRPEGPGLWVMDGNPEWLRTVPVMQRSRTKPDDVDTEGEDHHGDATRYAVQAGRLAAQVAGVGPVIVR